MNERIEYKLSNAWIWAASIAPLLILPQLLKNINMSDLSLVDWAIYATFAGFSPIVAAIYRAKIVISNDAFEICRGIAGGIWITKTPPKRFSKVIHPQEDHQKGDLTFVLENGKIETFDPVKSLKDRFLRKAKP